MRASTARKSDAPCRESDEVPLSLVRVRSRPARQLRVQPRGEAFRSTLVDPTNLAPQRATTLPEDFDARLEEGFGQAIIATRAHVGLVHRRGDAFFYTVGVRGLDRGMHMMVWVSMWDAAIQVMLRGQTLVGWVQLGAEHATVARRLRGTSDPTSIVALPVTVGESVEAVVELGRFGRGFASEAGVQALAAMQRVAASSTAG